MGTVPNSVTKNKIQSSISEDLETGENDEYLSHKKHKYNKEVSSVYQ